MTHRLGATFLSLACATGYGQDFEAPIVETPTGYASSAASPFPSTAELLTGWTLGATTSVTYDSNVRQSPGLPFAPIEDDIFLTFAPSVTYRTEPSQWNVTARGMLDYDVYWNDSNLTGASYSGGAAISYVGKPLTVTGSLDASHTQGINRYYSNSFVETNGIASALLANYQWSPKTSLEGRLGYISTEPEGSPLSGTENTTFQLSALWRATPLVTVGPGLAWTLVQGDSQIERETIGPILRLNYKLGAKILIDGTIGADFVSFDGGADETSFSGRVGAVYRASTLWSMNLSLFDGTSADGAAGGVFRDTTSIRLGYTRKLRRATLGLGAAYELNEFTSASTAPSAAETSREFWQLDASLRHPVFWGRAEASTFYTWRCEFGEPQDEWSGSQVGFKIGAKF